VELHALGSRTASVRLTGTPTETLPVRMRHAQPVLALISAPSDRQQSSVGEALPLVMKLRHGVKLVTSDAVHDMAPPTTPGCPDAGAGAATTSSVATTAPKASSIGLLLVVVAIMRALDLLASSLDHTHSTWS
jgi:hypothetical protein